MTNKNIPTAIVTTAGLVAAAGCDNLENPQGVFQDVIIQAGEHIDRGDHGTAITLWSNKMNALGYYKLMNSDTLSSKKQYATLKPNHYYKTSGVTYSPILHDDGTIINCVSFTAIEEII